MTRTVEVFHSRREHRHTVFWKFGPCPADDDDAGETDFMRRQFDLVNRKFPGYSRLGLSVGSGIGYVSHAPKELVSQIVQELGVFEIQSETHIPMWLMRVVMREVDTLHQECPPDDPRWQEKTLESLLAARAGVSATPAPPPP